ncbi:hypothetical protein ACFQV2_13605 [Actinokineospora soli]|uniref:Uncharacterized protein n=1 Tax=Actinokineospora soli TaxID=1048753 RepID=A0ABW2TN75_9PSEU
MNLTEYAVRALTHLPGLRRRDGLTRRTAGLLVERGRIVLFLDGLDEMPSGRRGRRSSRSTGRRRVGRGSC